MKDILMITHFTQTPDENGNGRFVYIANMLENAVCTAALVLGKIACSYSKNFYCGEPCRYHIDKKAFSQEVYDALVLQRTDLTENGFPRYRA